MTAAMDERDSGRQFLSLSLPKFDGRVRPHDPFLVGCMEKDRRALERGAPLQHCRVIMRMRNGDAAQLRQRRNDDDTAARLREWRATLRQYTLVAIILIFLVAVNAGVIPSEKFFALFPVAIIAVTLAVRFAVRGLPRFLERNR